MNFLQRPALRGFRITERRTQASGNGLSLASGTEVTATPFRWPLWFPIAALLLVAGAVSLASLLQQRDSSSHGNDRAFMASDGRFAIDCLAPRRLGFGGHSGNTESEISDVVQHLRPSKNDGLSQWLHAIHLYGPECRIDIGGREVTVLEVVTVIRLTEN